MTKCNVFDIDGSFSFHDEIKTILMRYGFNGKDTAIIISGTKLADPLVLKLYRRYSIFGISS